jgi:hypothetical protein
VVGIDNPIVWDGNSRRILYAEGGTLWSLNPYGGVWTSRPISGTPPDIVKSCAVFDPAGNRVLRFGGTRYNGSAWVPVNDVWELSLGAAPAWRKLLPAGTAPLPRQCTSMVLDEQGQRVIVFGGSDNGSYNGIVYNDVFALSLSGNGTWSQLIPNGAVGSPVERQRHTAVYDPGRRRMVLFGGTGTNLSRFNDVWELPLSGPPTWQSIPTTGAPTARFAHAAVFDVANDRMIVQGGGGVPVPEQDDTFALPFGGAAEWTVLPPRLAPGIAVYDAATPQMLISIGTDTHALDLGSTPAWRYAERHMLPRTQANAALAADSRTLVVVDGLHANGGYHETWTLDLKDHTPSWVRQEIPGGPGIRDKMAMVWDPVRARILAFGGPPPSYEGTNDVWSLTLGPPPAWTPVTTTGTQPPLWGWNGVYDPSGDRIVFLAFYETINFPGPPSTPSNYWNWIQVLPLSGPNALQWQNHNVFPASFRRRLGASFSYDAVRDQAWIFGGVDSAGIYLGDLWRVSLEETPGTPQLVPGGGAPTARAYHAAMFDDARDQLLVLGGRNATSYHNTFVYVHKPNVGWSVMTTRGGIPTARAWPVSAYDAASDRLVMYGGTGTTSIFNDTWTLRLDLATLPVEEDRSAPAALALAPMKGNPMVADIGVSLTLPTAGPGSLALLDVSGRRVRSVSLDGFPPGTHAIPLAKRGEIPAGVYFAALRHASGERRIRVVVLP